MKNPFKASLGVTPPALVGREEPLDDIGFALANGPGTNERISIFTGPRGVGKTVLLNAVEDMARGMSWRILTETATPGFTQRLRDAAYLELEQIKSQRKVSPTSFSISGFGVNWQAKEWYTSETTLRRVLTELFEAQEEIDRQLNQEPVGILITLDELHHSNKDEVISFSATLQHLVRENRNISVMMAGIPSAVKPLLAAENGANPITFLRRANHVELGPVSDADVRVGLLRPVEETELSWEPAALDIAVDACGGYPFQIQLVGQWSFQTALRSDSRVITVEAAQSGIAKALRKLGQLVHNPALEDLSDTDRTFLAAMACDDGPSYINDIARRMDVSAQYAGIYRRRLIDAEMVRVVKTAYVDFTLPYMREYLREHTVVEGIEC
ncbi:MAG: ATP-binding protein [Rothia sp. (in: high G+C Gram-positive bacteria)]|nr:ATP-binding protein [Rothia sp. (in: high G+C Gram-positive bacteria)]